MTTGFKYHSLLNKVAKTFVLNPVHRIAGAVLRGLRMVDFPVPPNSSIRKTGGKNVMAYYHSGIRSYLPIATMAEKVGLNLRGGELNVLDFGCGVGRQLLQFTRAYPHNRYFACDIDDTAVAFIAKHYPQVTAHVNSFTPPLDYPQSHFDLVYSVSIFSHLNMEDQMVWLRDLARVTKPGGYLFLTTDGPTALNRLAVAFGLDGKGAVDTLRRQGYIYRAYDDWEEAAHKADTLPIASGLVGVKSSYGNTAISPERIRQTWNAFGLSVVDIIEGIIDRRQDLVVLKRE